MPTDVAASLPQLDLLPGTTLTVTLDDPGAVIVQLVVHGWQELTATDLPAVAPLLAVESAA